MRRFPMTADGLHRALVPVVLLVLTLATVSTVGGTLLAPHAIRAFAWGAMGLAWVSVVLALVWGPRAVEVGPDGFSVRRLLGAPLEVSRDDIVSVEPGPAFKGDGVLRLFGTGGFSASYGLFSSRSLGHFRLYTRSTRGPTVVVRRRSGLPLVLGADDAEALRTELQGLVR